MRVCVYNIKIIIFKSTMPMILIFLIHKLRNLTTTIISLILSQLFVMMFLLVISLLTRPFFGWHFLFYSFLDNIKQKRKCGVFHSQTICSL